MTTPLDGFDADSTSPSDLARARADVPAPSSEPREASPADPTLAAGHVMGALGALEGALHLLKSGRVNREALSNLFGASVVMISEAVNDVGLSFEALLGQRDEEPGPPVVDSRR